MADISEVIQLSEGDLVLTFNKTIDLMRQVRDMLTDVLPDNPLRWALLEALSPAPDHRSEPRTVPRIQTTRTLSPSAAISSPGWS